MVKRLLLVMASLVIPSLAYAAILLGPLSSGSSQAPPVTGTAPIVGSLTCNIALPIINQNVVLTDGGTCNYTATCNAVSCTGMDAITSWAITAQSTANAFAVNSTGTLRGGSAAGSVTTGAYTVTVTATNATGTSPGVVQTVNAFAAPVVAATPCSIKSPISNGVNVVLQAGGNCQYTATCSGGACSGANAITAWTIASQTCTGCYQVTSAGVLQGGANAANVGNTTATVNLTASNAGGTSPIVAETITAITAPVVSNKNFSRTLPMVFPDTLGTMTATANPASWAITAVSGAGAGPTDFAISNSGVLTTTASAVTDITSPGTVAITVTATNGTGTSAPATATLAVVSNPPPLVQSKTCNVTPPVTNGVAVNPSCTFTATCGGGSCIAPYAVTNWTIVSQTHAGGFTITSGGVLQGGSNGAATTGTNTVTVTATNSVATSPAVGETVNVAGVVPVVTNGSYVQSLPLSAGNLSPAMTATNSPTSWAVTGASGASAQVRDFSISNGGVLALTSFAPTDITTAGTVTINVGATNAAGTGTGTATLTVNAAGTLPAGVTLKAIDGETMTGTVQSHNFYAANGHSNAVSMGWDSPGFIPIGPFDADYNGNASAYAGKTNAQVWADVGWNVDIPPNPAPPLSLAMANGVALIGPVGGAGGDAVGTALPLPYVGIYMVDEPIGNCPSNQYACVTTPITGTANAIQDSLFFMWVNTWHWNNGLGLVGAPAPNTPSSIMAGVLTTPNGTHRHRDMSTTDMYFFSEIQWGFMTGSGGAGSQIYGITMTDAQARRGTNYGDMIDIQRSYQTTFPAPIFSIVEDGNPFNAAPGQSVWITPPQYDQALWASIIHGARAFNIFDHNFDPPPPASQLCQGDNNLQDDTSCGGVGGYSTIRAGQTISMYNQMKATQNRIHNMAPIINSPFAIGYASAATVRYNYPGSQTPGSPTPIGNGIDMATHWYQGGTFTNASGTFNNGFYVFATPSNAMTDTNISAAFTVKSGSTATVVGEARSIPIVAGAFSDTFAKATTVHIYQIN